MQEYKYSSKQTVHVVCMPFNTSSNIKAYCTYYKYYLVFIGKSMHLCKGKKLNLLYHISCEQMRLY